MRAIGQVGVQRCTTGSEVMALLLSSERVYSDMLDWLWFGEPEQICTCIDTPTRTTWKDTPPHASVRRVTHNPRLTHNPACHRQSPVPLTNPVLTIPRVAQNPPCHPRHRPECKDHSCAQF
jgi:hypothetical protein